MMAQLTELFNLRPKLQRIREEGEAGALSQAVFTQGSSIFSSLHLSMRRYSRTLPVCIRASLVSRASRYVRLDESKRRR